MKHKYVPNSNMSSNRASFARNASVEVHMRQTSQNAQTTNSATESVQMAKNQTLEPPIFSTNHFQGQAQDSERQDSLR